ncbi:hypothetical protein, partial [Klebsiella quasipneumoniae]|uniref:hypothetical protein n=1 Tax=Klebsiella quasipneumoniae TaxID=1463165 RepID=UPI0039E9F744
ITRRQRLDLILQTDCCGGLNLFRVSNYDDILFKWINIFDNQCLILYPVKYTFEYLLHELSDMLHIWDMYPTQCVVPLTVKERAFWPFSLLFAT